MSSQQHSVTAQLEHLQAKYAGTGHADLSRHEWLTNQLRDSFASYPGHFGQLAYMALAEGECVARMRANFVDAMVQPCGPPPPKRADI